MVIPRPEISEVLVSTVEEMLGGYSADRPIIDPHPWMVKSWLALERFTTGFPNDAIILPSDSWAKQIAPCGFHDLSILRQPARLVRGDQIELPIGACASANLECRAARLDRNCIPWKKPARCAWFANLVRTPPYSRQE